MTLPRIVVATCQFVISADIRSNSAKICTLIARAAEQGAHIVHLPETALSGYAGAHFQGWESFDWQMLLDAQDAIASACRRNGVWAVFGTSHHVINADKHHNAVVVIGADGRVHGRYDKRRCSVRDLESYQPGVRPFVFEVDGVRCGVLVCLEWSFPELWSDYAAAGVDLVLLSAYGAGAEGDTLHTHVIPPTLQGHAFTNCLFISASNACNRVQAFPSMWVRRSGRMGARGRRNMPGLTVNAILDEPEKDELYRRVRRFRTAAADGSLYDRHRPELGQPPGRRTA